MEQNVLPLTFQCNQPQIAQNLELLSDLGTHVSVAGICGFKDKFFSV